MWGHGEDRGQGDVRGQCGVMMRTEVKVRTEVTVRPAADPKCQRATDGHNTRAQRLIQNTQFII